MGIELFEFKKFIKYLQLTEKSDGYIKNIAIGFRRACDEYNMTRDDIRNDGKLYKFLTNIIDEDALLKALKQKDDKSIMYDYGEDDDVQEDETLSFATKVHMFESIIKYISYLTPHKYKRTYRKSVSEVKRFANKSKLKQHGFVSVYVQDNTFPKYLVLHVISQLQKRQEVINKIIYQWLKWGELYMNENQCRQFGQNELQPFIELAIRFTLFPMSLSRLRNIRIMLDEKLSDRLLYTSRGVSSSSSSSSSSRSSSSSSRSSRSSSSSSGSSRSSRSSSSSSRSSRSSRSSSSSSSSSSSRSSRSSNINTRLPIGDVIISSTHGRQLVLVCTVKGSIRVPKHIYEELSFYIFFLYQYCSKTNEKRTLEGIERGQEPVRYLFNGIDGGDWKQELIPKHVRTYASDVLKINDTYLDHLGLFENKRTKYIENSYVFWVAALSDQDPRHIEKNAVTTRRLTIANEEKRNRNDVLKSLRMTQNSIHYLFPDIKNACPVIHEKLQSHKLNSIPNILKPIWDEMIGGDRNNANNQKNEVSITWSNTDYQKTRIT